MKNNKIAEILRPHVKSLVFEVLDDVKKNESKICEKLDKLRDKLVKEVLEKRGLKTEGELRGRHERRVQLETVSKLIDVPVNELMLHFMNGQKLSNESRLIEYHVGNVHFYFGN